MEQEREKTIFNKYMEPLGKTHTCVCGHSKNVYHNDNWDGRCFRQYNVREWDGSFETVHLFPLQDRGESKGEYIRRIEKLGKVTIAYNMGWKRDEKHEVRHEISTAYAQSILRQPR